MYHPDFWMTPIAATSFNSGRTFKKRPWSVVSNFNKMDATTQEKVKSATLAYSKLHPADPDWATVCTNLFKVIM